MLEPEQGNVALFLSAASRGSLEVPKNSCTGMFFVAQFDTKLIRQKCIPSRCIHHKTRLPLGNLAVFSLRCNHGSCAVRKLGLDDFASLTRPRSFGNGIFEKYFIKLGTTDFIGIGKRFVQCLAEIKMAGFLMIRRNKLRSVFENADRGNLLFNPEALEQRQI